MHTATLDSTEYPQQEERGDEIARLKALIQHLYNYHAAMTSDEINDLLRTEAKIFGKRLKKCEAENKMMRKHLAILRQHAKYGIHNTEYEAWFKDGKYIGNK